MAGLTVRDQVEADARFIGRARARRNHDRVGVHALDVVDAEGIVAPHGQRRPKLAEVMDEVVGEAVVVIDDQDLHGFRPTKTTNAEPTFSANRTGPEGCTPGATERLPLRPGPSARGQPISQPRSRMSARSASLAMVRSHSASRGSMTPVEKRRDRRDQEHRLVAMWEHRGAVDDAQLPRTASGRDSGDGRGAAGCRTARPKPRGSESHVCRASIGRALDPHDPVVLRVFHGAVSEIRAHGGGEHVAKHAAGTGQPPRRQDDRRAGRGSRSAADCATTTARSPLRFSRAASMANACGPRWIERARRTNGNSRSPRRAVAWSLSVPTVRWCP